ncbi:MAG TPA: DUF2235 domain-containing protein [Bradyrhizobium sp.]|nr:DUF2235 domain-containing protein [Bradyrhizobium sp.]
MANAESRRRLVLLLDGTWNEDAPDTNDTNVVRMRDLMAGCFESGPISISVAETVKNDHVFPELGLRRHREVDYFFFYERGVGTGPTGRFTEGALGWGLGRNIRRAYKFLSANYRPGTEIFIFGFSRGAFTARSLVGYLGASGLLKAKYCTKELEERAWSNYRTAPNDRMPAVRLGLEPFTFSFDEVRVACLGVFDTVGALGIPSTMLRRLNRSFYEFHDVELSPIVRLNLHALAIDEHRKPFEASVWRQSRFRWSNSITEQTWFPGVHSDIGGSCLSEDERKSKGGDDIVPDSPFRVTTRSLDDIALDWMLKRVAYHFPNFLPMAEEFGSITGTPKLPLQHESRTWQYKIQPRAIRSIGNLRLELREGEVPVSFDRRESVVGENVHISALERLGQSAPYCEFSNLTPYLPSNLIAAMPDLYELYCSEIDRPFATEAIRIVNWDGTIVSEKDKTAESFGKVRSAIEAALNRLLERGIDVLKSKKGTMQIPS